MLSQSTEVEIESVTMSVNFLGYYKKKSWVWDEGDSWCTPSPTTSLQYEW